MGSVLIQHCLTRSLGLVYFFEKKNAVEKLVPWRHVEFDKSYHCLRLRGPT